VASLPDRVPDDARVLDGDRELCSDGVTHEELRALLAPYAAGALDDDASRTVRAHLTGGCRSCLDELFDRPVGLPRTVAPEAPPPAPSAGLSQIGPLVAIVALSVALAAAVGWMIVELRARESDARGEVARVADRLDDAEIESGRLAARVAVLDHEVAAARDEASRQAEATRAAVAEQTQLGEDLAAARERIATFSRALTRRDAEIDRLRLGLNGRDILHQIVGTPDVDLLRLQPVAPSRELRGHALWRPGGDAIIVYAFNLPPPGAGQTYRVRLTTADGRQFPGPPLTLHNREATTVIPLDPGTAHFQTLEVILDPPNTPILTGRRPPG
jgi:hypothetical protein